MSNVINFRSAKKTLNLKKQKDTGNQPEVIISINNIIGNWKFKFHDINYFVWIIEFFMTHHEIETEKQTLKFPRSKR